MFFPHPLRDIEHQWCLVKLIEDIACPLSSSYLPSKIFQLLDGSNGSHNRVIASCSGYRQSSRPQHCLPQWFASDQSVGGRLCNHNAAPHRRRSTSSFPLVLHDPWSIHHIQERSLLRYRPLAASAVFTFLASTPRAVAIRSRILEILGSCIVL